MNRITDIRTAEKWNSSKWKTKYQNVFSSNKDWSDDEYDDELHERSEKRARKSRRDQTDWE